MAIKKHTIEKVNIASIKRLSFNRDTKIQQVKAIASSLSYNGLLRLPVCVRTKGISGKKEMYVVDGQHLLAALDRLSNKSVESIVVETDSVEEIVQMMAVLNNVSLKWTILDYVNAYTALGIYDYNVLKNHSIQNELNITVSAEILSGTAEAKHIKKGSFKIKTADYDTISKYLLDFNKLKTKQASKLEKAYVRFVRSTGNSYKHEVFMDYLLKNKVIKDKLPQDTNFLLNLLQTSYQQAI